MKKLILVCSLLTLSGCAYQDVPSYIIKESEKLCKSVDSTTHEITSWTMGHYDVVCDNGKEFAKVRRSKR